jgi:purine-nucleoside phosphorylase
MIKKKKLISCAFNAEAKPLIGSLKLLKTSQNIYENDSTLLVVCGIGFENTKQALQDIFRSYSFEKAINFGIAGCSDKNIPLGTLFCTTHELDSIKKTTLKSYEKPVTCKENLTSTLVDMEADIFMQICKKYLKKENIYIFKVVSDYLESTIPSKSFVNSLIQKNIKKVKKYV